MVPQTPRESRFHTLIAELHTLPDADSVEQWPTDQLARLQRAGAYRWNIPVQYGGDGLSPESMLQRYRELARASLLITFVLSQRNAACQRIETSPNTAAAAAWLPKLAAGELFATVGISHLTTSRQYLKVPAVTVTEAGDDYILNGTIPWATGAAYADLLVTGGTLSDGRQILAAIPIHRTGVSVKPPVSLMGLSASCTSEVQLQDVHISGADLLHGPVERVMTAGTGMGGAGSLSTSAIALGTAQGTLDHFAEEAALRPELLPFLNPLQREAEELAQQLETAAAGGNPKETMSSETLRRRANSLVMRSAQAWLASTRGAGYLAGHPAERAVRESLFFLVWSCPQPVLEGNLRELACGTG